LKSNVPEQTKKIAELEAMVNWLTSFQAAVMRAENRIRKLWAEMSSMKICKQPHSLLVNDIPANTPLSPAPVIDNAGYPAAVASLTRTPPTSDDGIQVPITRPGHKFSTNTDTMLAIPSPVRTPPTSDIGQPVVMLRSSSTLASQ
jgi:hypothetical protein